MHTYSGCLCSGILSCFGIEDLRKLNIILSKIKLGTTPNPNCIKQKFTGILASLLHTRKLPILAQKGLTVWQRRPSITFLKIHMTDQSAYIKTCLNKHT